MKVPALALVILVVWSPHGYAQTKSLTCVVDLLSPAQRQSIGDSMLAGEGQDKAQAMIESAVASCATQFRPEQINAAVQYANDTALYVASSTQLKALGAPAGLIDNLWANVAPAQRAATAAALKAGSPPDAVIADIQSRVPKTDDALSISAAALTGLGAKASMAMAEQAAG